VLPRAESTLQTLGAGDRHIADIISCNAGFWVDRREIFFITAKKKLSQWESGT
jgi:hypothetical protein